MPSSVDLKNPRVRAAGVAVLALAVVGLTTFSVVGSSNDATKKNTPAAQQLAISKDVAPVLPASTVLYTESAVGSSTAKMTARDLAARMAMQSWMNEVLPVTRPLDAGLASWADGESATAFVASPTGQIVPFVFAHGDVKFMPAKNKKTLAITSRQGWTVVTNQASDFKLLDGDALPTGQKTLPAASGKFAVQWANFDVMATAKTGTPLQTLQALITDSPKQLAGATMSGVATLTGNNIAFAYRVATKTKSGISWQTNGNSLASGLLFEPGQLGKNNDYTSSQQLAKTRYERLTKRHGLWTQAAGKPSLSETKPPVAWCPKPAGTYTVQVCTSGPAISSLHTITVQARQGTDPNTNSSAAPSSSAPSSPQPSVVTGYTGTAPPPPGILHPVSVPPTPPASALRSASSKAAATAKPSSQTSMPSSVTPSRGTASQKPTSRASVKVPQPVELPYDDNIIGLNWVFSPNKVSMTMQLRP